MPLTKTKSGVRTLATDEVVTATITDGAVTGSKLAALAVNGSKIGIGSDARGDLLFRDATQYTRLAAGTAGYFLKTQGAGADPVWAVEPGGLVPIENITGSATTYDFTESAAFDGTYRSVVLEGWLLPVVDDRELWFRSSTDGGTTFDAGASDYLNSIDGLVTGTGSGFSSTTSRVRVAGSASGGIAVGNVATEGVQFKIEFNQLNAAKFQPMKVSSQGKMADGQLGTWWGAALRNTAANIDGLQMLFETGNIADGNVTLYGLKSV